MTAREAEAAPLLEPRYENGGARAPQEVPRMQSGARERLLRALADLDDLRPAAEKRAALGIGERTWRRWAAEPEFRAALREAVGVALEFESPEAWRRLVAKMREGDLRAVDLFFKLREEKESPEEAPWMEIVRRCFAPKADAEDA